MVLTTVVLTHMIVDLAVWEMRDIQGNHIGRFVVIFANLIERILATYVSLAHWNT